MIWVVVIVAVGTLSDASAKLDKHPIPPSTYLELAVGSACLLALLVGLLLGKLDD